MMTKLIFFLSVLACLAGVGTSIADGPPLPKDLAQRQKDAMYGTENWLMYGGNNAGWRYSALDQINKENVTNLQVAWKLETGLHDAFECSPLIVDGTMYVTTPWNNVYALDARTGLVHWRYVHPLESSLALCCGAVNRGAAVGNGMVVFGTLDCHVIALDASTGKKIWDTKVADKVDGYSFTVAPMIIEDKVIIGASGADFGIRGFIEALNINSGKSMWRFWTVPGPGEPGHETWGGDSWKHGGASAWMPVTYDKETNLIFAGIGNPCPDLNGDVRPGDNLYSESTIALDVNSGKLKWYFQMIPHDVWDLDNVTETLLDDITIDGQLRKVAMIASKNGYFYVLDRTDGKCIYAIPYCHQINWGKVDEKGVATLDKTKFPVKDKFVEVYPGASGGKEWCPVAYNPKLKRLFIPVIENGHRHKLIDQKFTPNANYWAGVSETIDGKGYGHIAAIDVEKKKIAWDVNTEYPMVCGMLCTASGLVISGTPDQKMLVLDADNGKILHTFTAPSGWHSAPVSYAVDGRQYIAFPNGWGGWVAGFDSNGTPRLAALPDYNTLFAFALPEKETKVAPKEGGK